MDLGLLSFKKIALGKSRNLTGLLLFILFFSVFSGSLRKWVIGNATVGSLITFAQVGLPWLLLWPLLKNKLKDTQALSILFSFLLLLGFFAANPLNTSWLHGLSGIIIHSSFLIFFTFYFNFKESLDFGMLISWIFLFCLLQAFIGAIQSASSPDSWINVYAGFAGEEAVESFAMVGNAVRVTGTFSYLSGYTSYLLCFLFFNCYLLKRYTSGIWTYIITLIGLYCALISGARAAVGIYVLTLIVFIIFETDLLRRPRKLIIVSSMAIFLLILNISLNDPLGVLESFQNSFENFMLRVEGSKEEGTVRIYKGFIDLFFKEFDYRFTGIGLGSTYQGINHLMGYNPLLESISYEGELFRLMLEGGVVLVLCKFLIVGYILSKLHFSSLFKVFLFLILGMYTSLVFNAYNVIFAGIGLMILDQAYEKEDVGGT